SDQPGSSPSADDGVVADGPDPSEKLLSDDPVGVLDSEGAIVGFVDSADLIAPPKADERVISNYNVPVVNDDLSPNSEGLALQDALGLVSAKEVRSESGELVGYFGTRFVSIDDFESELDAAQRLIAAHEDDLIRD